VDVGQSNRPIFVIGCPRSGTTLLTLMLHSHSRIAIPPETRFLLEVVRRRAEIGDLSVPANRRALARLVVRRGQETRFRHLGLNRRQVRRAIVRSRPTMGSALGTVYRSYAARFGKPRWGDKRPTYFRNVELLRALFPDAQFVHLVRDGRDCVASLKRMRWWQRDGRGSIEAIAWWVEAVDCARRAKRSLPADSFYEVRYEDLVSDPRRELEALCTFLGEDFEESMLESEVAAAALPERQRLSWHANTGEKVDTRRIGSHATGLEHWERRLMEFVAGRRLRRFGYQVPDSRRLPRLVPLARYLAAYGRLRTTTRVSQLRDRRTARPAGSVADLGSG
jgi:hypothetical protein